ncbi:DcuS/MalK family sensor histidine kinase [Neobacillus kokaensis]|uniref:histidine kinase n=1 Tax=Neobacillus kokaensis TaxID=2759023 RepID=A0ABQ3MYH5_9BACI|nr:DcuS/MalK family sensor histidine kinase [Neobacillus kokaensis]GHH96889.1 two-component system sensor histidine kinase DcuS [Neobacillus kokaensis]
MGQRGFKGNRFTLKTTIILLVLTVVLLALLVTDLLISNWISERIESSQAEKATDIARIVARSPVVINGLSRHDSEDDIQTFTNEIKRVTKVNFVVVMDMKGIRKSHPNKREIGKHFVGGDEGPVLNGKEHISIAKGTLGISLRAFTPIYDRQHKQIGAVAVGISLEQVNKTSGQARTFIYIGVGAGLVVGILGALFLARKVKQILFGLEPIEIAKLLEERSAMLQSTKEGILAVDQSGIITLVNTEGTRLFHEAGYYESPIGSKIKDYMPYFQLNAVLDNGVSLLDQEHDLNGITLITNSVPVEVNESIVGAITTFREKTEIKLLAEQLTGVKQYAEALRTQAHEFRNKLHAISGLVQMKDYQAVSSYIEKVADQQQNEVEFVVSCFKDPVLAGFILGKLSYARENGCDFLIEGEGSIPKPEETETIHEVITILGNLIDNALDAVQGRPVKKVILRFDYYDEVLVMEVHDTGGGIAEEHMEQIFLKGISTKGPNRGHGLYLVKQSLGKMNGMMEVHSKAESGTTFIVTIPYKSYKKAL